LGDLSPLRCLGTNRLRPEAAPRRYGANKRPVRVRRQAAPAPARHRPGARSARREMTAPLLRRPPEDRSVNMIDCFRQLSRRTKAPARAGGQARAPCGTAACRLHLEKLEDRALPGNILFGGLLALPGQSAPSPLDDSEDLAAMVRTSSWGAGGSALAAG